MQAGIGCPGRAGGPGLEQQQAGGLRLRPACRELWVETEGYMGSPGLEQRWGGREGQAVSTELPGSAQP